MSVLTEGGDCVLVSGVEHVRDGDAEEAREYEDGERDDDDEGGVADDAVAPSVVRGQLHEHRAQEGPREEALATRAHPALQEDKSCILVIGYLIGLILV